MTSGSSQVDPFEVLKLRRRLKSYKKSSTTDIMKLLKRIREMKLDNKMLLTTEIPRTLIYIANRTK
jgi:hypothetical protein